MGGTIDADSTPGVGSTFGVWLRVAAESERSPAPVSAPPPALRSLKVLIVDDDEVVGRVIGRALAGHVVINETRGSDALTRLRAGERFDSILCDLMMAEMSSKQTLRRAQSVCARAWESRDLHDGRSFQRERIFFH